MINNSKDLYSEILEVGPHSDNKSVLKISRFIDFIRMKLNLFNVSDLEIISKFSGHDSIFLDYYKRDYFIREYGWSVPCFSAISKIKEFVVDDKVIEVGSGYGLWARLIRDIGVDIIATDALSVGGGKIYRPLEKYFIEVEDIGGVEAVRKYDREDRGVLMMSWPPYESSMAYDVLGNFRGDKFIYIGEDFEGCCGNDLFFRLLGECWERVGGEDIPQWEGIHDSMVLWVRKGDIKLEH